MERNLAQEAVRATEAAALAAARFIGRGDERAADRVAAEAMRNTLNSIAFDGKIVVGEGDRAATELLYTDEIVGTGAGPEVDVALDALEGSLICATGGPNALACVALYLVRRTAILGAVLMTGYLGGAVAIQITTHNSLFGEILFPVYFGILMWLGLFLRDERVRALAPWRG